MNFAEYQAIKAINATALKAGQVSMKHMRDIMDGGSKEQTPAMRRGSLVHKAILEPDAFFRLVSVYDGTRRGKEWDAFRADHAEEWIIKPEEHAELFAISQAVHSNRDAHKLLDGCATEVTVEWTGDDYGSAKARLDGYSERAGLIEVKTTSAIAPANFARQFASLSYDIQVGWYALGCRESKLSADIPAVTVICIESDRPHDVAVYRVPRPVIDIGIRKAIKTARAYRDCERFGDFPGVVDGVQDLVMPDWWGSDDIMTVLGEMSANEL